MISEAELKELVHAAGMSNESRLLLCLAVSPVAPRTEPTIRGMAMNAGVLNAKKMNVATYLSRARGHGFAIKVPEGWELTKPGRAHVATFIQQATLVNDPPPEPIKKLRDHLKLLAKDETRAFVEEAVLCAENRLYRSAVVLSWVGAVAVLQDHVIAKKLAEFNAEATKRLPKWKAATTNGELSLMRESDFLQVLQSISVLGKNLREELDGCLKYRNACGHPSSLQIMETRVVAHIDTLLVNVFERY